MEELNSGETLTANYTITELGSFGPELSDEQEVTTVVGDLTINIPEAGSGDKVVLQNLDIRGELNVDLGDGNLELNNVKLKGVNISNIGENSLYIRGNTSIGLLTINDSNGNARVVVEDDANVYDTNLKSGARLEVAKGARHRSPFANITISPTGENGDDEIRLDGQFDNIRVEKPARVSVSKGSSIRNQISIESSAELNIDDDVEVSRVDISNTSESDRISLSGNLRNVNVNSSANIEVKSGSVSIGASDEAEKVKVSVSEGATVETGRGSIETSGDGSVSQKENLSNEAVIIGTTFESAHVWTSQGEDSGIWGVPSAITVNDLIRNLIISDFARAVVIDESGNRMSGSDYISRTKEVKIISESGEVERTYSLDFEYSGGDYNVWEMGLRFDNSIHQNRFEIDQNEERGRYTGEVKFQGARDQNLVDGYLVGISGRAVEEQDGIKRLLWKTIYEVFIPKTEDQQYSVMLEDIDLRGYTMIDLTLGASIGNRVTGSTYTQTADNPANLERPSTEGIVISDFEDTNLEKGKIEGTVEFTRADDESNISHYRVQIRKQYDSIAYYDEVGIVEPGDDVDGLYTVATEYPVAVGLTDEIKIVVIPVNSDGIEPYYQDIPSKSIVDRPEDEKLEVQRPRLFETTGRDYSLTVRNTLEGSQIRLYKYDSELDDFVIYKRSGSEVVSHGSSHGTTIDKLDIGRYKATQTVNGIASEMSEEALVRPIRLSGILQNGELSLVNAIDGATIRVYDSKGSLVDMVVKEEGLTPRLDTSDYSKETYSITQTVDGIESSRFVLPLGEDYTIADIEGSVIASLNRANISASIDEDRVIRLKKKEDGKIGQVSIDTGAYVNVSFDGSISELVREKLGTSYLQNTSLVSFNVESSFDTLAEQHDEFWVYLEFDGQHHSYRVVVEADEEITSEDGQEEVGMESPGEEENLDQETDEGSVQE